MAAGRWLYANAKMEGDRKDYFVRICDPMLEACKGKLIELSNRLLSVDKRRGKAQKQICWFAGRISREIYLVAAGGGQEELLGISKGRYREQYCVLGYGFSGSDMCLLKKDDAMFEPLKEIMREIQRTGTEDRALLSEGIRQDFSAYRAEGPVSYRSLNEDGDNHNIRFSTEQTDQALWKESLRRPVMLGIISTEDGKRLLQSFPDGIVTVMEDVRIRYDAAEGIRNKGRTENGRQPQQPLKSRGAGGQSNFQAHNQKVLGQESRHLVQKEESREKRQLEQKKQELKKQKRLEQIRLVKYWAGWCKAHLSAPQAEAARKAVEHMKKEKKWSGKESGFFRMCEYSAYMLLWYDKKKRKKEQEIYFMTESWADTMNMKKTVQLAEMIERLNGTSDRAD